MSEKAPLRERIKDALFKRHNQPRCSGPDPEQLAAQQKQTELEARILRLEEQVTGIGGQTTVMWEERRYRDDPNYIGEERRREMARAH